MKIGVTGYHGRLGSKVMDSATSRDIVPLDCDLTDYASVCRAIQAIRPDVVINCAAYTDVDGAERQIQRAFEVNARGVAILRVAFSGWLIHLSTDYVFGGMEGPYDEGMSRLIDPAAGVYGMSKAAGERVLLLDDRRPSIVVRTTLLYGNPSFPDFVGKVLGKLSLGEPFRLPTDLQGSPTYIPHLCAGLLALTDLIFQSKLRLPPILHIAGQDVVSRHQFGVMIAATFGGDPDLILPITQAQSDACAPRPLQAGLRVQLANRLGIPVYSAQKGLEEYKHVWENL